MTPLTRGAEAYRQTEARSRSPLELVVMLYDGAIRFITEAQEATAAGHLRNQATAISKALAIVGELQSTLDIPNGGPLAAELDRLYSYMQGRLLDATAKQDAAALIEVRKLLLTLREGWAQIAAPAQMALAAR